MCGVWPVRCGRSRRSCPCALFSGPLGAGWQRPATGGRFAAVRLSTGRLLGFLGSALAGSGGRPRRYGGWARLGAVGGGSGTGRSERRPVSSRPGYSSCDIIDIIVACMFF